MVAKPVVLKPIEFKRAERKISSLLIGLCGPAGAGKTMSAHRLARGLARGAPVVQIDTENGRGLLYAPEAGQEPNPPFSFDFLHYALDPPFTPQRYRNAVVAACKLRPGCVIIDQITHEWDGEGGMLDMVEDDGGTWRSWKTPKKQHTHFMNLVTHSPCHFIFCIRTKEKYEQIKNGGKWEIVSKGHHPVCQKDVPFDMTLNIYLKHGVPFFPNNELDEWKLQENMRHLVPPKEQFSEDTGSLLANWCTPPLLSWEQIEEAEQEAARREQVEHELWSKPQ